MDNQIQSQFQLFLQFQQFLQLNQQSGGQNISHTNVSNTLIKVPSLDQNNILQTQIQVLEQIDLSVFKIHPCGQAFQHNHKQCSFYHGIMDRRRSQISYSADICESIQKAQTCPNGDLCSKSHNIAEVLYRADQYKSKYCQNLLNLNSCEYGQFCPLAHSDKEITSELIHNLEFDEDFYIFHYKTVWCPFNFLQHSKTQCVYAHSYQDYRRKPHGINYLPQACSNWKSQNDLIVRYEDNCKLHCQGCHGKNELLYHPQFYKTMPCQMWNICKDEVKQCPFYHGQNDQRIIHDNVQSGLFKYMPRNRVVAGTFKAPVSQTFGQQQNLYNNNNQNNHNHQNNFQNNNQSHIQQNLQNNSQSDCTTQATSLNQTFEEQRQLQLLTMEFENLMQTNQNQH